MNELKLTSEPSRLHAVDVLVKILSVATICCLPVLIANRHLGLVTLPCCLNDVIIPIATAAAIGYLTNYCAIWMLFKPYQSHGIIPQGVIPANQKRLAAAVGAIIQNQLLDPERMRLAMEEMAMRCLESNDVRGRIRKTLQQMAVTELRKEENQAVIKAYIEKNIGECLNDTLEERLKGLVQGQVGNLLPAFKQDLTASIREYIKSKVPGMFADMVLPMAEGFIENLDWTKIGNAICRALVSDSAMAIVKNELNSMVVSAEDKVVDELEKFVQNEEFWTNLENAAFPAIEKLMKDYFKENAPRICDELKIAEQVKNAINGFSVQEMHALVLEVSGRELTLLQVLGYFLGGIAGSLLVLN